MENKILFGSVDWSKDATCVYLQVEGTTSYFQVGPFGLNHPVHRSAAFLPGQIPTVAQAFSVFPELKTLSWETTMYGSFPSIEVHGKAGGLKIRLLDVADKIPDARIDERRKGKWESLYRLGEVIRRCFQTA